MPGCKHNSQRSLYVNNESSKEIQEEKTDMKLSPKLRKNVPKECELKNPENYWFSCKRQISVHSTRTCKPICQIISKSSQ
jgi:hypothetical protein